MAQVIRYLYEYDNGERVRNIGFIKVEKQSERCTVHIHGKGIDFGNEKWVEVCVVYIDGTVCVGVPQGRIEGPSPVINYILKFDPEDVGDQGSFEAVCGIVIKNAEGRIYAAIWSEEAVDIQNMRNRESVEVQMPEEIAEEEERVTEENSVQERVAEEDDSVDETVSEQREEREPVRESLIEHVEKLVEEQAVTAVEEREDEAEEVEDYIQPKTRTYEKIQRQDISRLARREWRLANNSFLLHGFYNYHHLLYIEEGDNYWLGVPGVYHEKERTAARAFGFPQFHRITDADVELSPEERNTFDDFGYWCRQVER